MKATLEARLGSANDAVWTRLSDYAELTKPRITLMVLLTTAAGYYLGASGGIDLPVLLHTLLGTALVAAGASALNMWMERSRDGLMRRTLNRPLPSGRISAGEGLLFAGLLALSGILYLMVWVHPLSSLVAAVTLVCYTAIYTPLKARTWMCTLAGAVPGALPPTIGWAAARGELSAGAWILFGILFFWQLPHFYSIAWIYRDDYRQAGFPMLSVIDRTGVRTGRQSLLFVLALIVTTGIPSLTGLAGSWYGGGAMALGGLFLLAAVHFHRQRDLPRARALFAVSVGYLPALLLLLVLDRTP